MKVSQSRRQELEILNLLSMHLNGCVNAIYRIELNHDLKLEETVQERLVESVIALQRARLVLREHGMDCTDILERKSNGN
jgi:protein tyrosine/serine phosphatase